MQIEQAPLFSIVICNHDRKQYLINAVDSALEQDFPKDMFEIIVVKNYYDEEIDNYLMEHKIFSVFTEDAFLPQKMVKGVENSKGSYICFLDDDDLYKTGKLKRIATFIEKHGQISFYHDSFFIINELGRVNVKIQSNTTDSIRVSEGPAEIMKNMPYFLKYKMDWYASMMCINREIVKDKTSILYNATASADRLLFLIGISNGGVVILDNERNTYYRLHQSLTTKFLPFTEFMKSRTNFYYNSLHSFRASYNLFENNYAFTVLDMFVVHETIMAAFTGAAEQCKLSNIFKKAVKYSFRFRTMNLFIWYVMLFLKKIFRSIVVKLYYILTVNELRRKSA